MKSAFYYFFNKLYSSIINNVSICYSAAICRLVWWFHVGINGKKHSYSVSYAIYSITFIFQPEFYQVCHTKAEYEEYGPQICRFANIVNEISLHISSVNKLIPFRYNAVFGCMT